MSARTIDWMRLDLGRFAAIGVFAAICGLSFGWAANGFDTGKPWKRRFPNAAVSPSDMIKTDLWKTFGETGEVVMIGDSHTDFAEWNAMFPGVGIVNRGVSGDTTRSILARLDTILSVSAAKAVVTIGTNDILRGYEQSEIVTNYHAILDCLIESGLRVVVTSTPLTSKRPTNDRVNALNADLRAYCGGKRCTYVDLNAAIGADGLLSPVMTVDGIHLSGAGYARWAAALAPHLRD